MYYVCHVCMYALGKTTLRSHKNNPFYLLFPQGLYWSKYVRLIVSISDHFTFFCLWILIIWWHDIILVSKYLQQLRLQQTRGGCFQETQGGNQEMSTVLLFKPIKHLIQQTVYMDEEPYIDVLNNGLLNVFIF